MGRRGHVVVIAYPSQGHLRPLLKLSHLIAESDYHDIKYKVTFINAASIHSKVLAGTSSSGSSCEINFVSIPDGLDLPDPADRIKLNENMLRVMPGKFEDLIRKLNLSAADHVDEKISCVIADIAVGWALEIAEKMGIRTALFWHTTAGTLAYVLRIQQLIQAQIINHNGNLLKNEMIQISPKIPALKTDELVWSNPGDPIMQSLVFEYFSIASNTVKISNWLLCNSFYELEPSACDLIPDMLPIGSLLIDRPGKSARNFWPEDSTSLEWLDKQPAQSVIYVAFGSIAIFNQHQFEELALGLEHAGRPFLWVVRSDFMHGSIIKYPDGFLERVTDRGKITEWVPQEKVLAHPSVACFLTHCGWNSTIESLSIGIPFLCWPYFADHFLIKNYICEVWKVGLGLNPEKDGIVSRHGIKTKLDELLCDGDIRENLRKLKEMDRNSVDEGGSSMKNFEIFMEQLSAEI